MKVYKPVDPYRTRLNPNTTYHLAVCSELVYGDDPAYMLTELKKIDRDYEAVHFFECGNSEAAFIAHSNYLVYAFRGTDEPEDWLANFNVLRVQDFGGHVHRGFHNSLMDVWPEMEKTYQTYRMEKRRPVFLTGHSKGAAVATLCAALFSSKERQWPFTQLVTFGSPRCVEWEFSRYFDVINKGRTFRFQNNSDMVTRLPQRIAGYAHVGQNIYISEDGQISTEPGFWNRFCDVVSSKFDDLANLRVGGVSDHQMGEYRRHIELWEVESE